MTSVRDNNLEVERHDIFDVTHLTRDTDPKVSSPPTSGFVQAEIRRASRSADVRLHHRHAGTDVLAFFKWIDLHVEPHLDIHVVLDNLSAHKSAPVRDWLAHPRRARWHLHFTPTSASWLNLIEGWFSALTERALKDASFDSVAALEAAIELWASHRNDDPQLFVWTKTVDDIIAKVKRGRATLDRVIESATYH